jgi:hypothetical protein
LLKIDNELFELEKKYGEFKIKKSSINHASESAKQQAESSLKNISPPSEVEAEEIKVTHDDTPT